MSRAFVVMETGHEAGSRSSSQDVEGAPPHILAFLEHFTSLVWMTYRTNFPAIQNTGITTDCGWGCMVRSGQMILATSLNRWLLGKPWRLKGSSPEERIKHRRVGSVTSYVVGGWEQ